MVLLIEFFKHSNLDRYNEYLECIRQNILNDYIEVIEVIISDDSVLEIEDCDKLTVTNLDNRPTYNDFFEICNKKYKDRICIISNADIIFTESLSYINDDNIINKFLALSRWDINRNGSISLFDRDDSQDCWIFKSPILLSESPDFYMGKPGCDNRIANIAKSSGLLVTNPSKQIIIKHLHLTNLRNYTPADTVYGHFTRVKPNDNINIPSILVDTYLRER